MRIEQAEIVTFRKKALEAPSVVKTEQQSQLKKNTTEQRMRHLIKNNLYG